MTPHRQVKSSRDYDIWRSHCQGLYSLCIGSCGIGVSSGCTSPALDPSRIAARVVSGIGILGAMEGADEVLIVFSRLQEETVDEIRRALRAKPEIVSMEGEAVADSV